MTATRTAPQPTTRTQRMDRPTVSRGSRQLLQREAVGGQATSPVAVASSKSDVTRSQSTCQPPRRTPVPANTSRKVPVVASQSQHLDTLRRDRRAPVVGTYLTLTECAALLSQVSGLTIRYIDLYRRLFCRVARPPIPVSRRNTGRRVNGQAVATWMIHSRHLPALAALYDITLPQEPT